MDKRISHKEAQKAQERLIELSRSSLYFLCLFVADVPGPLGGP